MTCAEVREHLSARVDGQLPDDVAAAVERHLTECTTCRVHAASIRALKHAIAQLPSREEPPGAVRARVEALRFRRRRVRATRVVAWLMTVAAGIVIAAAFYMRGGMSPHDVTEELVADHLRSVPEVMPAEVASQNPDDVRHFFHERVSFPPVTPLLPGARLMGGRLCRINGARSQLLFYQVRGRTLSLFVSPTPLGTEQCEAARGNYVCGRRIGNLALTLVGDLPADTLRQLLADATM
jgi:anti-sigma factor RsiW